MKYTTGNLLDAKTEAIVNTVNTVGVMGKGIALQFRERFPVNYKLYLDACKKGEVKIGKMFVSTEITMEGEKIIINFPTKTEWYKKSQYEYIDAGLKDLVQVIKAYKIKSIAIPPLGCGNGGLKWEKVKDIMQKHLSGISNVEIQIYEPHEKLKEMLQRENEKRDVQLKPGRAMLLYTLYRYERLGEVASVFAANKLAYFLQKSGENLKLDFVPYMYGPYAQAIDKVLYALNGKYLKGMEQMKAKPFEPLLLVWERFEEVETYIKANLSSEQVQRLNNLFSFIEGFESTLALELLASIHFLMTQNPSIDENQLYDKIQGWSERKSNVIKKEYIPIAMNHLKEYSQRLNFG